MQTTKWLSLIAGMFFSASAYATSLAPCGSDSKSPYEDADSVVLAQIESIEGTDTHPELKSAGNFVARIHVQKYWKLKDTEIPTEILFSAKGYTEHGLYIFFLNIAKSYKDATPIFDDTNAHYYQTTRCAPIVHLTYGLGVDAFGSLSDLLSTQAHEVIK